MRFERFPIVLIVLLTLSLATVPMFGQSLTTGNINGTVTDPSNAVVPNATVSLKSLDTGSTATSVTTASGAYNFGLLKPGRYEVSVKQSGFAEVAQTLARTGRPDFESRYPASCRERYGDCGGFRNRASH